MPPLSGPNLLPYFQQGLSFALTTPTWTDYAEGDFYNALVNAYARAAHQSGLESTPTIVWPRDRPVNPTPLPRKPDKTSSRQQSSSSRTSAYRADSSSSFNGIPVHASRDDNMHVSTPLTDEESRINLQSMGSIITTGRCPARLLLLVAPGEWPPNTFPPYINLELDLGSCGLWTLHPAYKVKSRRPHYRSTIRHLTNSAAANINIRGVPKFTGRYIDDSYYDYLQIRQHLTIDTGHRRSGGGALEIRLPFYRSQLAASISEGLDKCEIDGIIGFGPQPLEPDLPPGIATDRYRRTFMNQLYDAGSIRRQTKVFALSPSYKTDKIPKLWILDVDWPPPSLPRLASHDYPYPERAKTITLSVCPPSGARTGWRVKLRQFIIVDMESGTNLCEYPCCADTLLDTGTELTLLPRNIAKYLMDPDGPAHAFREGPPNSAKYYVRAGEIKSKYWVRLGFEAANGDIRRVSVAPLRDVLTYRNARTANGDHLMSIGPVGNDLQSTLGLNILRYLWQCYYDHSPAWAQVQLAPGWCR
ncbi:hypothetical protein BD626DRAFT_569567 [Schizophyllum amplum]|uniref:Aspartic peptidase domain-containing protein n=1 Tax=Schizophyllum amplum TaxID=97359 RepID=A0A550CDX5_9AGAR|nr:hypothetical protein BD626DRAFT_569567 [Auriculariopsis ampla]